MSLENKNFPPGFLNVFNFFKKLLSKEKHEKCTEPKRGPEAAASCGRVNPTHETGPHDPHALLNLHSIFDEKEASKTGAHGGLEEHAHVEQFGCNAGAAGGKGYLFPFVRRSPEMEDVHKGPRDDARAGKRAGASR